MCEGCSRLQKILMNPLFHSRRLRTFHPPPPPASQENQLTRRSQWRQETG